jgi:type VII secretion-associated serine protease mycosin
MLRRAVAVTAVLMVLLTPAPALARGCARPPAAGSVSTVAPVEAQVYDVARLAPVATGAGVRVAVVDSGVDDRHPQLRGAVAAGRDVLRGGPDARQDCVGHGTGVAGIIAARAVPGVPFRGLAPGVTIVPVRVSEKVQVDGAGVGDDAGPAEFAEAIAWAADPAGGAARVINVSVVMAADDPRVRRAVAGAVAAGVVVVAAAGNGGGSATPFPAAYPGVIGVGAVTADGVRAPFSQRGGFVDVVAAGSGVTVPVPGGGHAVGEGTSFAAPFVAATAALVVERFPGSTPAQVARRVTATADPAPGGGRSDEYGYGLLNPYRAVAETLGPAVVVSPAPVVVPAGDPAVVALRRRRAVARERALVVGAAGVGVVVLAGLAAGVLRRGRRRGWRPASGG